MDIKTQTLKNAFDRGESIVVVHYACESLYTATDHPPAVSSIATQFLVDGVTHRFSRTDSPADTVPALAEQALLERFFEHLQANSGTQFVHWNMSRAQYGFEALAARYRHMTGNSPSYTLPQSARHDLDDLVAIEYGDGFAKHPKMVNLARLNGIQQRYALAGAEEAEKYEQGDFGAIDRSTAEKVGWIAQLCRLLLTGELETLTSAGKLRFAGGMIDAVAVVRHIGERLLYVQRELSRRHGGRAAMEFADEYDDQDLFRSLLRIFFDDVRPEDHVPEYAGGSSRIDFVIPEFGIAVELKHSRAGQTAKQVGDELLIDVRRYAAHGGVRHLVCIVLDHDGRLENPRGLEGDLAATTSAEGLAVSVAIIDR